MDKPLTVLHKEEFARIRDIVDGDGAAFGRLVCEYHDLAYGLAFKTLNDRQDAEEVVQDAFLKVHRSLSSFRGEASLKTWIMRIVLRLSLNRRRDRSRSSWNRLGLQQQKPEAAATAETALPRDQNPESHYISEETRARVLKFIDELPEGLREVLILNSLDQLSYDEIARILRIPSGTVGSRIHAARSKLARRLRQQNLL